MVSISKTIGLAASILVLSACSAVEHQGTSNLKPHVTNFDGTGKALSAQAIQNIVSRGVPATAVATVWCTRDPLPNPLPANFKETDPTPKILPNMQATSGFNQLWLDKDLPKRVWCFVKNEGEQRYNQCSYDPAVYCVDGSYFVINAKGYQGITWINFTNQHSDKTRVVRLVWEE